MEYDTIQTFDELWLVKNFIIVLLHLLSIRLVQSFTARKKQNTILYIPIYGHCTPMEVQ